MFPPFSGTSPRVLLAFIVDCVLFQVPTPYSMPWWLAHHGTLRVASCTFQLCFGNIIYFKLEAVSRGASLASCGAPRTVLGEGYCDHSQGVEGTAGIFVGWMSGFPQAKDPGDVPGPTHAFDTRYMYPSCISGAYMRGFCTSVVLGAAPRGMRS